MNLSFETFLRPLFCWAFTVSVLRHFTCVDRIYDHCIIVLIIYSNPHKLPQWGIISVTWNKSSLHHSVLFSFSFVWVTKFATMKQWRHKISLFYSFGLLYLMLIAYDLTYDLEQFSRYLVQLFPQLLTWFFCSLSFHVPHCASHATTWCHFVTYL